MRQRTRGTFALAAFAVLSWSGASTRANFASTTGAVQLAGPPASTQLGGLVSDTQVFAFAERQSFTTTSTTAYDTNASGLVSSYGDLHQGSLLAGTMLDSYLIHSDAVTSNQDYSGSITFSTAILGVIVLDASLDATDSPLGAPSTQYATGLSGRGLELNPIADFFSLSSDMKTISFSLTTGAVMDEIRIFTTASIPEPISAVLLSVGGLCAFGVSRARRKRRANFA